MSKYQTLRVLVMERLAAAAEEICALFERTIAEHEEELCRSKGPKNQRKPQHVDIPIHIPPTNADPGLNHGLNQEPPLTPRIKEELEELSVKPEEEQFSEQIPESMVVCVKIEESSPLQQRQTEQIEDTSVEPHHFHSEAAGHTEPSSHTDNHDDWRVPFSGSDAQIEVEIDGERYNQVDNSTAENVRLLYSKYRSAPEMSATVDNGGMSGTVTRRKKKKHQCFVCEKTFQRKQTLQQHIRVHTGEKPFSCSICKRRFSQRGNLNTHIQIHTGEKPFSCLICNKTFSQKCTLTKHITIHTGVKLFSCSICKKAFNRKSVLNRHTETHMRETTHLLNL